MKILHKTDFPYTAFGGLLKDQHSVWIYQDRIEHNLSDKDAYVWNLEDAIQDPTIQKLIERTQVSSTHPFSTETFTVGVCIVLPEKSVLSKPVYVVYPDSDSTEKKVQTLILGSQFSKGTFVEIFESSSNTKALVQVEAHESSKITHVKMQMQNETTTHEGVTMLCAQRKAVVESISISLGGEKSQNFIQANLAGEYSSSIMDGIFVGREKQKTSHDTKICHLVGHTESFENYKGILTDQSHGVFRGRIFVGKNAQKIQAKQMNRNLLLSEEAQIDTSPELEILADDVKCAHGATIGKLDPQQLFYLQSRGIPQKQAYSMMIHAFVSEVVDKVADENFANWCFLKIEEHLHVSR
ncbi:MAG: Fe-S cluster assembly protein SufD [Bdellovibrionales bacterium]|nr:Fe-S cluster assembly protein SufD [Bdellovibrionales bacterium]